MVYSINNKNYWFFSRKFFMRSSISWCPNRAASCCTCSMFLMILTVSSCLKRRWISSVSCDWICCVELFKALILWWSGYGIFFSMSIKVLLFAIFILVFCMRLSKMVTCSSNSRGVMVLYGLHTIYWPFSISWVEYPSSSRRSLMFSIFLFFLWGARVPRTYKEIDFPK